jgi:hypothetical protein
MDSKGVIIFLCKYCKRNTDHEIIRSTEKNGQNAIIVKCAVCKHTSWVTREKGRIVSHQEDVPERYILLPYDKDYKPIEPTTQEEVDHHKKVDKWLDEDGNKWMGKGFGKNKLGEK